MLLAPFDLSTAAHQELLRNGFEPDFPPEAGEQLEALRRDPPPMPDKGTRDLRGLLWSSIDNGSSRDLDQIEYAEPVEGDGIRILVGIADVDWAVPLGSPIDRHAAVETTSVYTAVRTFPMLPPELSTGLTSLNENEDRAAIVIDMTIDAAGAITGSSVYHALVRNKAQLNYETVGPWLMKRADPPPKIAAWPELQQQIQLQDRAAQALDAQRHRMGALDFDRVEAHAVIVDGQVQSIETRGRNRASELIEDFMVAVNVIMAQTIEAAGVAGIQRVVRSPERWPRIVELAARYGEKLPPEPDSGALNAFLQRRKAADSVVYADLSLSVIKLLGPGEYILAIPGGPGQGHFGLAAHDYTHSTAPNRRFADLVTQRLIKSVLAKAQSPYSDDELAAIARNCTSKEDAARKVERIMNKRVAAVALQSRIGQMFRAVVTGVTPKGTFVRVVSPPAEGRLVRGEQGVDVGDHLHVKLLSTDPERGYIDFGR